MPKLNIPSVPDELTSLPQWVAWRYEERNGKSTKVPYDAHTGERASTIDPASWAVFDKTMAFHEANDWTDGIGFVVTEDDGIVGVDLDHCRDPDTGAIDGSAKDIVDGLRSYTEITPSGAGLRIYVKGRLPAKGRKKGYIEMYEDSRYFTVTGNHLEGTPRTIEARQEELTVLHVRVFGEPRKRKAAENGAREDSSFHQQGDANGTSDFADSEIIEKARKAANGAKFETLWAGDFSEYPSHSEADLALCAILGFWSNGDGGRIDRLFRQSGLMRDKWDERHHSDGRTYGETTIEKVLESHRAGWNAGRGQGQPRWVTAREFLAEQPEDVAWLWEGYVAPGNVTVISARPKGGKTTLIFHLLAALMGKRDFLGKATRQAKVLVMSEEPSNLIRRRLANLGLTSDDLLIAKRSSVTSWDDALAIVKDAIYLNGVNLLVIDTLGAFWGIDDENGAGKVMAALQPLLTLAQTAGMAVLLLHHLRKSPGAEGTASRGSSALAGSADILVEIHRDEHAAPRRKLTAFSRYDETPRDVLVELRDEGYRLLGTTADVKKKAVKLRAIAAMPGEPPGKTQAEIREDMEPSPSPGMLSEALKEAEDKGLAERSGAGRKGDPYRYWRVGEGTDSDELADASDQDKAA